MSVYVSARAAFPARAARIRRWRDMNRFEINSTWIDDGTSDQIADFPALWAKIEREIREANGLVLYALAPDFPLRGALVEVGMAIGIGKRVAVFSPGVVISGPTRRPFGSWLSMPQCRLCENFLDAYEWADEGVVRE